VKLVAGEGLSIVDADLLKLIPHSVDDWRDRDLLHLAPSTIDSVAVTNNGKAFVVGRDSTNGLWRMIWPLFQARADGGRIRQGLGELESLRIERFVSDDPKADLEAFGLQTPNLEIAMAQGTNLLPVLQLGKSPTNHAELVFARRAGQSTIVTVRKALLATWQVDSVNAFRDPHLLELVVPVERIEVHGEDVFNLDRQTNGAWRVAPQGYPADGESVSNLISALTGMVIVQFAKDVATPLNWPEYGLAAPVREYVLESAATNEQAALTNPTIADLSFGYGTNQPDKVFVRRADETSVYAVSPNDFAQLPPVSWQMRDRRIWRFLVDDLAGLTIQQGGKKRELIRRGDHEWSLAAGSQGIIDEAAIDESVRNFLATPPLGWMAVGETNRSRFGFTADGQQLIFMLKNGPKPTVEFGGDSPTGSRYAGVMLDGQFWVMELPWSLNRYVLAYLSLPEGL
jgi:hypothetical protein